MDHRDFPPNAPEHLQPECKVFLQKLDDISPLYASDNHSSSCLVFQRVLDDIKAQRESGNISSGDDLVQLVQDHSKKHVEHIKKADEMARAKREVELKLGFVFKTEKERKNAETWRNALDEAISEDAEHFMNER
jgi:hypothetical protein